jgi:uncharacterized protein YjbI with pentapeptide repeats
VLLILVIVAVATSLLSALDNIGEFGLNDPEWRSGWLQNFSTEMMGAIVTFALFELLVGGRKDRAEYEKQRREKQANAVARLRQANSPEIKQPILDEMRELNLLQGADLSGITLRGVNLESANLQRTNLARSDLQGATLVSANLQWANLVNTNLAEAKLERANMHEANLQDANLREADLQDTNLKGAGLERANLQGADLWNAYLQGARLSNANLREAKLWNANLLGAQLWGVKSQGTYLWNANLEEADLTLASFDDWTKLPDRSRWTPDADMTRFTDFDHPDFWRSEDTHSPAYRGDSKASASE